MYKGFIDSYYSDINNITDSLTKLVSAYRFLIGGAEELNRITPAKKKDVKDALKRVSKMGEIIDNYLKVLDNIDIPYLEYCKVKSDYIRNSMEASLIISEIEEEFNKKK